MRKFIPIIFIFIFCSNVSLAEITCTKTATTACEKGCYVSNIYGCTTCDNGTYTSTTGASQCTKCNGPQGATFESAGQSDDGCQWSLTCIAGYHYVSNNEQSGCQRCLDNTFTSELQNINATGYSYTRNCTPCGANSTANNAHTNCNCNEGYHISGEQNSNNKNNGEKNCEPNIYTITYKSNNGENQIVTETAAHNSTITLKGENTFYKTGHTISGWKYNDSTTYKPNNQITYDFQSDIELTAQWSGKPFTITYDTGEAKNCTLSTQECTYGANCNSQRVESCTYTGYIFRGWKCTSGCTDSNSIIDMGTNISTMSKDGENITLTAQWEQCQPGYYCTSVLKQDACPAGSTSDAGSSAITNCHMTGGTTQICDGNTPANCFTLPDNLGSIYYHGEQ